MRKEKQIEAQVTTAAGTTIVIKGDKKDVTDVLSVFAGQSSGTGGAGGSVTGTATPKAVGSLADIAEKDQEGNVHILNTAS